MSPRLCALCRLRILRHERYKFRKWGKGSQTIHRACP
jgi:hypothetical protein